jgi:hypothetical protein
LSYSQRPPRGGALALICFLQRRSIETVVVYEDLRL